MDPVLNERLVREDWKRSETTAEELGFRLVKQEGVDLYLVATLSGGRKQAVRLHCNDYPDRAPDMSFVDPETLQPIGGTLARCISGIRHYYDLHPERLSEPGIAKEWRIYRTLATVYTILHGIPAVKVRR